MDDILTPVKMIHNETSSAVRQDTKPTYSNAQRRTETIVNSVEDALEALRNEPNYDLLLSALRFLSRGVAQQSDFSIARPSPVGSQLIQALTSDIASNYWTVLREDETAEKRNEDGRPTVSASKTFLTCLRSIPGINAVLLRLRALTREAKSGNNNAKRPDIQANIRIMLEIICCLLEFPECIRRTWNSSAVNSDSAERRTPLAQEFLSLFGSGRLIGWAAEAQDVLTETDKAWTKENPLWVTNGAEYSEWVTRNVWQWTSAEISSEDVKLASDLLARVLRLGHADGAIKLLVEELILSKNVKEDTFTTLINSLPILEQRKVLHLILNFLSKVYLNKLGSCDSDGDVKVIGAAAGVLNVTLRGSEARAGHMVSWLTMSSGAGLGDGIGIRRAALTALSQQGGFVESVFEKTIALFGDPLYVKHSPTLQQDAHAQVLLLSAGYTHRLAPLRLIKALKSSAWLNAISNRLAASQQRARFLGMVVGEALSSLTDGGEKKLDFHMEETNSDEAIWYKNLIRTSDSVGPISVLVSRKPEGGSKPKPKAPPALVAQKLLPSKQPQQGFVIEEVEDSESDSNVLVPYAKPDSDTEDSDDDPTLVRRDKPKAPVYIRDLIRFLRNAEDYDQQKLGLSTAPSLIRRKGKFGTEVKEHAEELASVLIGLQDKYEIDDFYETKIQGMIALVVAQPEIMAPWFAKTFFDGDYSLSQRASVLAVLGISAREIAGLETSSYAAAASFPSKVLPEKVERLYLASTLAGSKESASSTLKPLPQNALNNIAQSLQTALLAPVAANAADAATGPDILKLSSFTSRLQRQQSNSTPSSSKAISRPRVRVIPNDAAKLIATFFFLPLTARFQAAVRSPAARTRGMVFQPLLLSTYLRTLAILLHAAGQNTLALPQMTAELWDLLLGGGVRAQCAADLSVARAALFALLALLDVNEDRMRDVCRDMSREVVETQEWVAGVFDRLRGDDGGEENEAKMLAAAVLIRLREGMEKYRLLLVGDMIGF